MRNLDISSRHLLTGDRVIQKPCPKNKKKYNTANRDTIIIHYTADSDAEKSADYLSGDSVQASAHLVIGRGGEIYQLVAFDTIAWHAGISHYGNRSDYNQYSIGIELDNPGWLEKAGTEYIAWFGGRYPANEVIQGVHRNETTPRYWHVFPQEQIETCRQVCELLINKYNLTTILGHEEISPGRKQDPGPAFPLDRFRNNLLYQNRADSAPKKAEKGKVIGTDFLNIREQAGVEFKKVAQPLQRNAEVEIVDEVGGWFLVETKIRGWVSKGYIEKI